jgi:hypothetical protein
MREVFMGSPDAFEIGPIGGDAMHPPSSQASDPAQSAKMPCSHSLHNDTASRSVAVHKSEMIIVPNLSKRAPLPSRERVAEA